MRNNLVKYVVIGLEMMFFSWVGIMVFIIVLGACYEDDAIRMALGVPFLLGMALSLFKDKYIDRFNPYEDEED